MLKWVLCCHFQSFVSAFPWHENGLGVSWACPRRVGLHVLCSDFQYSFLKGKYTLRIFSRKLNLLFNNSTTFLHGSVHVWELLFHADSSQSSEDEWVEAVPSQAPDREKTWKVQGENLEKEGNHIVQVSHPILKKDVWTSENRWMLKWQMVLIALGEKWTFSQSNFENSILLQIILAVVLFA